jgi:hypothetical protein
MPIVYYKAADGTLVPLGGPGPVGPEGPVGPQGPPGIGLSQSEADARYVNDKTKTVAGMCDDRFVGPNGGTWAKVAGARGRATPGVTIDVDGTYHVPPGLYNISMQGSNDVGFDRFVLSYDIDGWNGYGSSGQWICDHRASAGENGSGSQLVVVQESIAFYIYVLAGGSQGVNMRGQFARVGDAF